MQNLSTNSRANTRKDPNATKGPKQTNHNHNQNQSPAITRSIPKTPLTAGHKHQKTPRCNQSDHQQRTSTSNPQRPPQSSGSPLQSAPTSNHHVNPAMDFRHFKDDNTRNHVFKKIPIPSTNSTKNNHHSKRKLTSVGTNKPEYIQNNFTVRYPSKVR